MASRKRPKPTDKVYRLKITLRHVKPPVWRRVLVPDCTLEDLHHVIQIVMGWEDCHLHQFDFDGIFFMSSEQNAGDLDTEDSHTTLLSDQIDGKNEKFTYEYDFGDDWIHELKVEEILCAEEAPPKPICIKGVRACPPEDVGGPWGYGGFLDAIADKQHEEHEDFMEWIGGEFDPQKFDLDAVNRELAKFFK